MKHILYILALLLFMSCNSSKSGGRKVTFIVQVPEGTAKDKAVFISGDFEGWTGGQEQFKLQSEGDKHTITVANHQKTIHYKFTLGSWEFVERDDKGANIENRRYEFKRANDTINIKVLSWASYGGGPIPSTASKNVTVYQDSLYMPELDRYRKIRTYLPSDYQTSKKRYPVLYMHDGQNIFDLATSYAGEWGVDETLNKLHQQTGFGLIVVAIDNGAKRMNEYSPYDNKEVESPEGAAYVNFIAKTLKPKIDTQFRTQPEKEFTAIMGSSMGGLISHYAGLRYPNIFGKVGVFSPSFWISNEAFKLAERNSLKATNKMYLLVGGKEGGTMKSDTEKMVKIMLDNGFEKSNITSKIVDSGSHGESFWGDEFEASIRWLFSEEISKSTPQKLQAQPVEDVSLSSGTLMRIADFPSEYVQPRHVDVWLPNNYSKDKQYAVLYMHDGQMLFDSTTTWNNQEWMVDEWASKLMKQGKTKDFIVVAIHNISGSRWLNYYPSKALDFVPVRELEALFNTTENTFVRKLFNADDYLKFIVHEVKPFVDLNFATLKNQQNTYVAGSSMGGLISMYAVSEYPEVFAGAGCMSTHWVGANPLENNPLPQGFFEYMNASIPAPDTHKFYFDFGTKTLDEHYLQYEDDVNTIFIAKGYNTTNFRNLKFEGADHSESSWNQRLDKPLLFLLGK